MFPSHFIKLRGEAVAIAHLPEWRFSLIQTPFLLSLFCLFQVKQVAVARRAELEVFLRELLKMAPEISECDLVYTFFHPLPRDQQVSACFETSSILCDTYDELKK